jgi:zinc transport system permease protein
MVGFGAVVGIAIAFVREGTTLASDTVIGVFFAGAIGFGAMLFTVLRKVSNFNPEAFLFGSPLFVQEADLAFLFGLVVITTGFLAFTYNDLVFGSFNSSLARSRRVPLRRNGYLFIVLLALIVNLSLNAVGALLINALLVVPAATAGILARNLRAMFWLTLAFSVGAGMLGLWLSVRITIPIGPGPPSQLGPGGMIVVVSVLGFFVAMALPPLLRRLSRVVAPPGPR